MDRFDFCSNEWIDAAREYLQEASKGSDLSGINVAFKVFTDPPIADSDTSRFGHTRSWSHREYHSGACAVSPPVLNVPPATRTRRPRRQYPGLRTPPSSEYSPPLPPDVERTVHSGPGATPQDGTPTKDFSYGPRSRSRSAGLPQSPIRCRDGQRISADDSPDECRALPRAARQARRKPPGPRRGT